MVRKRAPLPVVANIPLQRRGHLHRRRQRHRRSHLHRPPPPEPRCQRMYGSPGAICPGSNDGPQTVPVCAAVPYDVPEDGTKYDCGWYDGSCSGEDRCVASKVATIGLGLLNDPAKKEDSAGIIRDDGSGAIVRLGNYTWTTDSSNVQYRKKKGNCPYGDWHNSDHEHKVMFMPIKGTLK